MPWDTSTRRARLPSDWTLRRAQVRARAGERCEHVEHGMRCPNQGAECDHVLAGDDHDIANLQWLCAPHHHAKTNREASAARGAKYQRNRPAEAHPGRVRSR